MKLYEITTDQLRKQGLLTGEELVKALRRAMDAAIKKHDWLSDLEGYKIELDKGEYIGSHPRSTQTVRMWYGRNHINFERGTRTHCSTENIFYDRASMEKIEIMFVAMMGALPLTLDLKNLHDDLKESKIKELMPTGQKLADELGEFFFTYAKRTKIDDEYAGLEITAKGDGCIAKFPRGKDSVEVSFVGNKVYINVTAKYDRLVGLSDRIYTNEVEAGPEMLSRVKLYFRAGLLYLDPPMDLSSLHDKL